MFALTVIVLLLQQATPSPIGQLLAFAGAVGTSYLLGFAKKLDTTVTNAPLFRKLQPLVTLGGAFLAPWVASHMGVTIDPSAFAAAPLATVATIAAAELLSLFAKKTGGT
jgi:hypothetical protein